MPRKDTYHDLVKNALEAEGWTITHDPYPLKFGVEDLSVDLGAEEPFGAEKAGRKIAVEIKSFLGKSPITDLERALGQYTLYCFMLQRTEPDRILFLAIPDLTYEVLFNTVDARDLIAAMALHLVLFDAEGGNGLQWIE